MQNLLCSLFGHRWEFLRNEIGPVGKYGQWWWEYYKCSRCGEVGRTLVAGERG